MSVLKRKDAGVWEVVGGGEAPPIQLGYAQVTANQSGITTEVDLTGLTVTVNVAAGRRIRITACVSVAGGSSHGYGVAIKEGATQLQVGTITTPTPGSQDTLTTSWVGTPSVGPHTYKLTMRRFLGATTPGVMFADATTPAFILVEDITGGTAAAQSGSSDDIPIAGRQGGSATDWSSSGSTNRVITTGKTKMQVGALISGSMGASGFSDISVTFPSAFAQIPLVIVGQGPVANNGHVGVLAKSVTTTGFTLGFNNFSASANVTVVGHWMAIGEMP